MKEELEEAAEKYAESKSSASVFQEAHKRDFIEGAKWQAERMYSEEEVLWMLLNNPYKFEENIIEWFEQNKNK